MKRIVASPCLQAFLAGAVAVFGFAPFDIFPLPILALAVLFRLWSRTERPAQAAWLGFAFGMGLFCVGIHWIYVALHTYGYMHPVLAAIATALFAAVNAALPAFAGYVQCRFKASSNLRMLLLMPAIWTLAEWLRGLLFTGFPWLTMGYAQVPNSPLAGYAPLLGVYGVSLIVAASAALLLFLWNQRWSKQGKIALAVVLVLWASGAALRTIEWTQATGAPLKVSLLQGNIAQDTKFSEDALVGTMETYRRLAQSSDARLTVMPETALPLLRSNVPESYQTLLSDHARQNGGDILIGVFEKEDGNYYNSVYSLGSAESQHYRKDHLVPFGEFIPLRSVLGWFINDVLDIPMGDLASGGAHQAPLNVAGQKVAVDICYEDAFGEEIIRALPQATLLTNVTNDAWYGDSHAAMQHAQLSQMRALETGRMMLRATNTGVTAVIGADGRIQAMLPQHEEGVLTAQVQGYVGSTPYAVWGNGGMLALIGLMLGFVWKQGRRR
ncbi:apolipoprotein N-acyltransferase [Sideroxydans lithotrophicus]|uniref:Apolipoprotein N-acyltransferase n=1 Tax=Sideroxydans lithotrophicus (strain ES-1) TaxID=580332 RepID=D5CM93_SIDLE|nr:apolipoprotein N-acyltransferase [Sideroxydans lithotrophicus]ADE10707.1 apolipoprotein N-acyltransferase [Sideroxydans lithotrophicus ES-1]